MPAGWTSYREVTLTHADIKDFLYRRAVQGDSAAALIPNADAFNQARLVARCDGLFLMEIGIEDRSNPGSALNPNDLDEIAYIAAMVAKRRLEHTHYHHNMPGKGRASFLKPSQILQVPPVALEPAGLEPVVSSGHFGDADARAARTLIGPATAHPTYPMPASPQALSELRQRFIRLEDVLAFRVRRHRDTQVQRLASPGARISFAVFGLLLAGLIFSLVIPIPSRIGYQEVVSLILMVVAAYSALFLRQRIARWDVPVIRLLRTAHGFFIAANPLNRAIEAIRLDGRSKAAVDGFDTIIANLESRIEGEQHRIAMGQNWLVISLGAASLVAALSAVNYGDQARPAPAPKPPPAAQQAPAPHASLPPQSGPAPAAGPAAPTQGAPEPRQPTAKSGAQPAETAKVPAADAAPQPKHILDPAANPPPPAAHQP